MLPQERSQYERLLYSVFYSHRRPLYNGCEFVLRYLFILSATLSFLFVLYEDVGSAAGA